MLLTVISGNLLTLLGIVLACIAIGFFIQDNQIRSLQKAFNELELELRESRADVFKMENERFVLLNQLKKQVTRRERYKLDTITNVNDSEILATKSTIK